jgi:hypothetical protein
MSPETSEMTSSWRGGDDLSKKEMRSLADKLDSETERASSLGTERHRRMLSSPLGIVVRGPKLN